MRAFLLVACALWPMAGRAQRVVSLNLCADDYLVSLAPERAVGVTRLARDPALSVVADRVMAPAVSPDAEAVLALRPDLVLAADYGAQPAIALLRARGVRVERIDLPDDFAGIRTETIRLAGLLGVPERGGVMLADFDRRMTAIRAAIRPGPAVRALWLEPHGWTSPARSLAAEVLRAAGFVPLGDGRRLDLEAILAIDPGLVVTAPAAFPSLATDALRHPALARFARRTVSAALTICPGPWVAEAVEALAR